MSKWEWAYGRGARLMEGRRTLLHVDVDSAWDLSPKERAMIAAAPELLDILNALLEMPTACTADHEVNENAHRRAIARALIERIEGVE